MENPPRKNLRTVEEDQKNLVSGAMSIEKEGDESTGGSRENLSEEAAARRLEELEGIFSELPLKIENESPEDTAALMRVGARISDQITRISPSRAGLLANVEASIREAISDAPALTKYLAPEISMEEVLSSFKEVKGEGKSKAGASKKKSGNPRQRRGEKKSAEELKTVPAPEAESKAPEQAEGLIAQPGDVDTHKEARAALRDAVLRFKDIAKSADTQTERADMESKEQAYIAAYKDLEQRKSIWNRLSKGKELKAEEEKVEALKKEFNESRITYAAAIEKGIREPGVQNMSEAFVSRMTKRYQKLVADGTPPLDGFKREQTLREYLVSGEVGRRERISSYITFREVVRPLAEKKLQARVEALDARGQGAFAKGLGWVGAQNQKLDAVFGETGARAVRAAASTLVVAGGAAMLGSFGTAGLLAVAGWGTVKFARAFGGAVIGAAAGELGALAYEKLRGRSELEKAKAGIVNEGNEIGQSFITEKSLNRLDKRRDTLVSRADESTLQKKKTLVKALVAMGVGAGAAAMLAEYTSVQQAADTVVEFTSDKVPESAGSALPASEEVGAAPVASTESAPAVPAAEAPYTIPTAPEGVTSHEAVIGRGEGFNHLIADLRASGFTGLDSKLSTTELSEKLGAFVSETGKSAVMLEGDKLLVDAKGNVWFERDGETQLLMANKDGVLIPHEQLKGVEMRAMGGFVASTQESVSSVVSPEVPLSETADVSAAVGNDSPILADSLTATNAAPEVVSTVGRSLESFSDQATQSPLPDSMERMPERSMDTIGRPLEDFRAQYEPRGEAETMATSEVSEASFINAHGVEINESVPSTYEWKVPGMDRTLTVSSGGSPEERSLFARSYVNEHPGTTVHFITPVLNNGVVEYRLDAWDSVEGGPAQRLEDIAVRESSGGPVQSFSRIDPRDFIRKLQ